MCFDINLLIRLIMNAGSQPSHNDELIQKLTQIVLENLDNEQFGVSELAEQVGMNRSHLYRKIIVLTKKSLSQFIREIRLSEAFKLLKEESVTVSEAAYRVGFNNPSYFNSCFHDHYGFPPGEAKHGSLKNTPQYKKREKKPGLHRFIIAKRYAFIALFFLLIIVSIATALFLIRDKDSFEEKSIAVLPFKNMSDVEEFTHLGEAITDEIIVQLYKINAFEVRSRTSIMQYKDTEKASPVIGRELNVNYLLEGSTQRYDDQIRIRVQLIHAPSDDHIWGEVYEGEWKDIFDIQVKVAKQVAREMKAVLSPEEIKRIEDEPTGNIEAYNLYLHGRNFMTLGGRDNFDSSIKYYKRALEIDPDYAGAYSGMADTYISYFFMGYRHRRDVMPKAKIAAMKALELDNTLGDAHAQLAIVRYYHDWDWIGSEMEFKRALELNPNNEYAHIMYASLLSMLGRHDEAILESKCATELAPANYYIIANHGRAYYWARDYNKAIEECRKALKIKPGFWYAHVQIAQALSAKGLQNEAIEEYLKMERYRKQWYLGYYYGLAGKKEKALEILNYYLNQSETEFVLLSEITFIYIGLGEKDKAFEWLEKNYLQHEAWLEAIKVEPMYDSLRSDPRFQDLVKRMNFPDN